MTVLSPSADNTTVFQDGQAPGAITASDIRTLDDSLAGLTSSTQTASYTLALSDYGTMVELNSATAVTFTVPPNSTVAFDVGTVIGITQLGAGQVTIVPGAGVTLRNASSLVTRTQNSTASIRQRAPNDWVVSGDLA